MCVWWGRWGRGQTKKKTRTQIQRTDSWWPGGREEVGNKMGQEAYTTL